MKEKSVEILLEKPDQIPKVEEVTLLAHDRETGSKAIVDMSTMDTICVVKQDNQIIQHHHVYDEVNKLENYIIKSTKIVKNGQTLIIEVTEREPKQIELLPKDFIECGARIFNDYGKSRGLSVQGFGTRLVCSNGMVAPKMARKMTVFAYGTSEFSKELEDQIKASFDAWNVSYDIIMAATEKEVSVKDILAEYRLVPKKYMEQITKNLPDKDTLYNVYNEYTRVIQHEMGPHINTTGLINLQKRANKILEAEIMV